MPLDEAADVWNKPSVTRYVVDYQGPSPPEGTGYHRYQLLLFEQHTSDAEPSLSNGHRGSWDLNAFVRANNLCHRLVAATQFHAAHEDAASGTVHHF